MRAGNAKSRPTIGNLFIVGGICLASPVNAEVQNVSATGFSVRHTAEVPVSSDVAFEMLIRPAQWWNSEHTYSGDASNLSLDARSGGCFCEALPVDTSRNTPGGVEHMRVIYVDPGRALRMSGALGPLQTHAVAGTMMWTLKPLEGGTRTGIEMVYVVGGYFQNAADQLSPAVEMVLGVQVGSFATALGGTLIKASSSDAEGGRKSRAR